MTQTDGRKQERRPGRPRSARADRAILQAAVELLAEEGFQSMSIEGIAERAGVGKTTIYRRFDSKEEIVIAAVSTLAGEIRIPDTGDTREDLRLLLHDFRDRSLASILYPVMSHVVGTVLTNPAVLAAFRSNLIEPRQAAVRTILARGVERGELRSDIDLDAVVDMIPGAIIFHILFKLTPDTLPPADLFDRLLDSIWQGIAAR